MSRLDPLLPYVLARDEVGRPGPETDALAKVLQDGLPAYVTGAHKSLHIHEGTAGTAGNESCESAL